MNTFYLAVVIVPLIAFVLVHGGLFILHWKGALSTKDTAQPIIPKQGNDGVKND